jgi:hypothetical protein
MMVAHELGHDGQLRLVSAFGEADIIRRVNGACEALGLPIRSERLPHSGHFVFPNERVPESERSFFNHSER